MFQKGDIVYWHGHNDPKFRKDYVVKSFDGERLELEDYDYTILITDDDDEEYTWEDCFSLVNSNKIEDYF